MLPQADSFHGSDLEKMEQIYGVKREEIVSFSANVNPLGVSPNLKKALASQIDAITTYPDREYTSLRNCISEYVGASSDHIIVGNGSTELISLFIQVKQPKKALILGPTYSEYEREINLGGGSTLYFPLKGNDEFQLELEQFTSQLNETIDLLVICNPNNPTSTSIKASEMRVILDTCKQNGIFVMIDETYVEFSEEMEEITAIPLTEYYNNLIILRGVSKFFAAPGLRLGYAVTGNMDLIKTINTRKNPWTINTLAAIAGELMFQDKEYISKTKELISTERKRICTLLSEIPSLKVYAPTANFVLLKILKEGVTSHDVFEKAIREKMMIRDCSTFPFLDNKHLRFCFMKPEDNDKLIALLKEI